MASTTVQPQAQRRSREDRVGSSFKKQEEIGRGSFATVYKATHTDASGLETLVAIKSVNMGKLNKKLKDNLTSEISILKSLHHPHIAGLIDCKETSQHIHLIMEYVALGDLSQFIKRREQIKDSDYVGNMMVKYPNPRAGGLHEVVVRHFLKQLADALSFLRVRNLIHRDVKPQNLLLNPSPEYFARAQPSPMPYQVADDSLEPTCGIRSLPMLKIADFGFARSLPSTSLAETLCGSPLYMAPEILRYEKYDAKADLWSVGTVLYEMVTARPPFRAANHVELLRKIEKTNDVIKFGDDIVVSSEMKKLIRSLLKRDPRERVSFPDFFGNEIITSPIPGLVDEDLPPQISTARPTDTARRRLSRTEPADMARPGKIQELESPYQDSQPTRADPVRRRSSLTTNRRLSNLQDTRSVPANQLLDAASPKREGFDSRSPSPNIPRPAFSSTRTAPGRQELMGTNPAPASEAMTRQPSGGRPKQPSLLRQQVQQQHTDPEAEKIAQDIAFERDYVLIEKKAVEVNALADELAANPRVNRNAYGVSAPANTSAGTMVRRATQQGPPTSTTGAQTTASRAVQIAQGKRPDGMHQRSNSYERRYGPSAGSATSAISRALTLASGRLFGGGFSPPVNFGRGGRSPPIGYNPFPIYPGTGSSLIVVGDSKPLAVDEDTRYVQQVEELATRSDVVFGFAEVKYKQLTPAIPSPSQPSLGPRMLPNEDTEDTDAAASDDLTVEALVQVSEEALVLYVKALTLLQKAMDTAGRWWNRKKRDGDNAAIVSARGGNPSTAASQRMNNVVQWTRSRFNEVLEKTDLVRLRLIDSQKRLPEDHASHPNNLHAVGSSAGLGTSADQVVVTSGVTAEKLMYDRALEMSRTAAINELTGEDLSGCEISYVTAIRMLEAVLESEDEAEFASSLRANKQDGVVGVPGLEAEDRDTVVHLVKHIRGRLDALRKKLHIINKRASAPAIGTPRQASPPIPHRTSSPMLQK
ncbi:Serine/threonine-protein kinase [Lithohypha guttulata]|nr:Serine/threonine-protein kinase [Lithohypha guttulata]